MTEQLSPELRMGWQTEIKTTKRQRAREKQQFLKSCQAGKVDRKRGSNRIKHPSSEIPYLRLAKTKPNLKTHIQIRSWEYSEGHDHLFLQGSWTLYITTIHDLKQTNSGKFWQDYFIWSKEINLAHSVVHATRFHVFYERYTWRKINISLNLLG